jgi:hypothetical protein
MIARVEVTPGPGTAIRYGSVLAWVGSDASEGLVAFLARSARNLATVDDGGRQIADHLAAILGVNDPEPRTAFAVLGPSADGWDLLLHGPVMAWDGALWFTPSPEQPWIRTQVGPQLSLAITGSGFPQHRPASAAELDLEAGVVPGGGIFVTSEGTGERSAFPERDVSEDAATALLMDDLAKDKVEGETFEHSEPADLPLQPEETEPQPEEAEPQPEVPEESPVPGPPGALAATTLRLRGPARPRPPLPRGHARVQPGPGTPVVAGIMCTGGHLNRTGSSLCSRCGIAVATVVSTAGVSDWSEGTPTQRRTSGGRPPLGCLVVDDGRVFRLDGSYLIGSDPARDPGVRGGTAMPLTLGGQDIATTHAEIRLAGWDVAVADRSSPTGTSLCQPGEQWTALNPFEPRVLRCGARIALGHATITFLAGDDPPPEDPGPTGPRPGISEPPGDDQVT